VSRSLGPFAFPLPNPRDRPVSDMRLEGALLPLESAEGQRLPRGRHGIPQELILANQRERLLTATASLIDEIGFAALTVADMTARAGVSRATFYRIFENKNDCVIAGQQWSFERLRETIAAAEAAATAEGGDWPEAVATVIGAVLAFTARHPGQARLILASSHSPSEPGLARGELAAHVQLARMLHEGALGFHGARSPSDRSVQAAVVAAMSLVGTCVAAGELDALPKLRADLIQIVLIPYLGGNEARRIAREA
jgi:AcrR family transcriptional regulator